MNHSIFLIWIKSSRRHTRTLKYRYGGVNFLFYIWQYKSLNWLIVNVWFLKYFEFVFNFSGNEICNFFSDNYLFKSSNFETALKLERVLSVVMTD